MDEDGSGNKLAPPMDIAMKIGLFGLSTAASIAVVITPTGKQKETEAMAMYNKPVCLLTSQQRRAAEFAAYYGKWCRFCDDYVYPITRKLPMAQDPIYDMKKFAKPVKE